MHQALAALEAVGKRERWLINAHSAAVARLGVTVSLATSMGKSEATEQIFLPFEKEEEETDYPIPPAAAFTIRRLIKDGHLPLHVAAMVLDDMPKPPALMSPH